MKQNNKNRINILNKKARFNYEILETYEAGIQLFGSEIKSIRLGKVSIAESFCQIINGELYVINMQIEEYLLATHYNHLPKRDRKLLLKKRELLKIVKRMQDIGNAIVPLKMYITDKGFAKLQIALAKGKKNYDKRQTIKQREAKKSLERIKKKF